MDGDQDKRRAGYLAFPLRLWRVNVGGALVWRASLQRPGTADQQAFADLDETVAFLQAETGGSGGGEATESEAPMG